MALPDFTVKIKVTDRAGNATQVQRKVTVTDPAFIK